MGKKLIGLGMALVIASTSFTDHTAAADSTMPYAEEWDISVDNAESSPLKDYTWFEYDSTEVDMNASAYKWKFTLKKAAQVDAKIINDIDDMPEFINTGIVKCTDTGIKHMEYKTDINDDDDSFLNGNDGMVAVLEPGTYYIYGERGEDEEEYGDDDDYLNEWDDYIKPEESSDTLQIGINVNYIKTGTQKRNTSPKNAWTLKNEMNSKSYFTREDRELYYKVSLKKEQRVIIHSVADVYGQTDKNSYGIHIMNKKGKKLLSYTGKFYDQYRGGTLKECILPKGEYIIKADCGKYDKLARNTGKIEIGIKMMDKRKKLTKLSVMSAKKNTRLVKLKGKNGDKAVVYLEGIDNRYEGKISKNGVLTIKTGYLRKGMNIRIFQKDTKGCYCSIINKKIA